jgi:hypothetical protein
MLVVTVGALVLPRVPLLEQAFHTAPAPRPVPTVTVTAVVTATASCLSEQPNDRVVLDVAGSRHQGVLDGCGRPPGTPVPVVVPADGRIAGALAVVGSGAQTPTATTDVSGDGVSPLVARLELALAAAAALGAGVLLVVVARDRAGASRRRASAHGRPVAARTAARAGHGRLPAQRSRAGATRRPTTPHPVRPARSTRSEPAARARRAATTRRRR